MKINFPQLIIITLKYCLLNYDVDKENNWFKEKQFSNMFLLFKEIIFQKYNHSYFLFIALIILNRAIEGYF